MGDANAWLPPRGVRGQLNDRFEQHTIGCLVSAPVRHWVPVLSTWAVRRCDCGKTRPLETNDGD